MKKKYIPLFALALTVSCNSASKEKVQASSAVDKVEQVTASKVAAVTEADYESLMMAALENQMDVVKQLLNKGCEINHVDENKRTPLMMAAFNGHTEIVKFLLDNDANAQLVDDTNRSALMFASTGPFAETVKVLLAAGSDVNGTDSHENWTPVMFAAGEGQIEVVKILLAAGADITMVDVDGESAYDFAIANGHQDMAAFLKNLAQQK